MGTADEPAAGMPVVVVEVADVTHGLIGLDWASRRFCNDAADVYLARDPLRA